MGLLTPRITTGLSLLHERGVRPWKEFNCAQKARQKGWFTLQHRRSLCRFVRRDPVPVPVKSWGRGAAAKALAPTTFAWRSYIRHHVIPCVHPNMTVEAQAAATVLQQPCPGRFRRASAANLLASNFCNFCNSCNTKTRRCRPQKLNTGWTKTRLQRTY